GNNRSTGYNQAMRSFMANAVTGEYPDFAIDFSKIEISKGALEKLIGMQVVSSTANTFNFTWVDTSAVSEMGHVDDQVFILLYNQTEDTFTTFRNALRQEQELTL